MTILPNISSAVWWAYQIAVDREPIGNLQSFSPTSTKTIDRVRQINFAIGPKVTDLVPGPTDINATLERIRMFQVNLFEAIGRDVVTIEDLNEPFDLVETLFRPGTGTPARTVYSQCLFTEYGQTIQVGTTFVMERATVAVATIFAG